MAQFRNNWHKLSVNDLLSLAGVVLCSQSLAAATAANAPTDPHRCGKTASEYLWAVKNICCANRPTKHIQNHLFGGIPYAKSTSKNKLKVY